MNCAQPTISGTMMERRDEPATDIRNGNLLAARAAIPVADVFAGPERDALVARRIVEEGFEIFDAVWRARDIGVDCKAQNLRAARAFLIESIELITRALEEFARAVVLHHHHGNVVELDRVRQGDQRPMAGD